MDLQKLILEIDQQIAVKAPMAAVFEGLIKQLSTLNDMKLTIERFPGGRWYRDLGNDNGHLWGFVQVIKPPTLLEIYGPMFMSYPVAGHLQLRLAEGADGVTVSLKHRAVGLIEDAHREGVVQGWKSILEGIKDRI